MNKRAQLVCLWSGVACAILFLIGAVLLGQFIPPLVSPDDTAEVVAQKFAENNGSIRAGALIGGISMALVGSWGAGIASQLRLAEGRIPVLFNTQIVCIAAGVVVIVLMCMFWAVAAFRPDEYSPETIMMLNDVAYFLFLFTWAPFSIWTGAVALAIFMDRGERPVFPRYVAYASLWTCVLFTGAAGMEFFKTGPLAWDGVLALYIPVGVFFVWLSVLTYESIRNVNRGLFDDLAPSGRPLHHQEA